MTGLLAINNHVEVLYDDGHYYGATIERAGDLGWIIRWDEPGDGEPTRDVPEGHIHEFGWGESLGAGGRGHGDGGRG